MTVDRYLRLIAGFFVMLSVALGYWVSPYWFLFTAFVGLNLFQSAFIELVPHDDDPEEIGRARVRPAQAPAPYGAVRLLDFRDPGNLF